MQEAYKPPMYPKPTWVSLTQNSVALCYYERDNNIYSYLSLYRYMHTVLHYFCLASLTSVALQPQNWLTACNSLIIISLINIVVIFINLHPVFFIIGKKFCFVAGSLQMIHAHFENPLKSQPLLFCVSVFLSIVIFSCTLLLIFLQQELYAPEARLRHNNSSLAVRPISGSSAEPFCRNWMEMGERIRSLGTP